MFKAEIGDFLYIIIFAVLMIFGGLEKVMKAKRQQNLPPPPQPYDDFEDVDGQPSQEQAPPQTIEEMMRRMMQTPETLKPEKVVSLPQEPKSLELFPEKNYYQPVQSAQNQTIEQFLEEPFSHSTMEDKHETIESDKYLFDIRQAIIASEILNRKY